MPKCGREAPNVMKKLQREGLIQNAFRWLQLL